MKKLVRTLILVAMVIALAVAPVSAATVNQVPSNGYQIEVINGCVVFYDANTVHLYAGENLEGRVVSVNLWFPAATSNEIQIIRVLDQKVVVTPTYNRSARRFTWNNPAIGLCGTQGLEFVGSKYDPSDSTVGGGYLTLDFIATPIPIVVDTNCTNCHISYISTSMDFHGGFFIILPSKTF